VDQTILEAFSQNRLCGELIPVDLQLLLDHVDEFAARTGVELNEQEGWAPWLDTSYLSEENKANPDIMANVRLMADVCSMIAFIAAQEDGEYYGYWQGPDQKPIATAPIILLDNEGQFRFCCGTSFVEGILSRLTYDEDQFRELRNWFCAIGITVQSETLADLQSVDQQLPYDELEAVIKKLTDR
jgi:hypothetical protein